MDLRARTDVRRRAALAGLDKSRQAAMGQFFTPSRAADLIASMVRLDDLPDTVRILDPGAGVGTLTVAIIERIRAERPELTIEATAVEIDRSIIPTLRETLDDVESTHGCRTQLVEGDYITLATTDDPRVRGPFDLIIQNPPYGKLSASSPQRVAAATMAVDSPNFYSAFWALSVQSLRDGGQCATLAPRSWATGTYFTAFRKWLLEEIGLDRLHVFESRSSVFSDTGVLQENVIVSGTKGAQHDKVVLSASVDHHDAVRETVVPISVVVVPEDQHKFVRFTDGATAVPKSARFTLSDLGLRASTGRVVDFRNRDLLTGKPSAGSIALVYQGNVRSVGVVHPLETLTKPQWLTGDDEDTRRLTHPAGNYVVVKRFTAKEERRRVVAGVWSGPGRVAFDNKTNYIHRGGEPLEPALARGLSAWLNSTSVDQLFRTFSGHTQVNAGHLEVLPFPDHDSLVRIGKAVCQDEYTQEFLDCVILRFLEEAQSEITA